MKEDSDLWQKAAYYVHSVSTPTATLQLNAQVLAHYLPVLVKHYQRSADNKIVPEDTLRALSELAPTMQESLNTLLQQTRDFSDQLHAHHQQNADHARLAPASAAHRACAVFPAEYKRVKKILMIEDEDIHRQVAAKQLQGRCQIDFAKSGLEAIAMWREQSYDLVVMDFLLPGMSGPQALDRMSEEDRPPPVVIGFTNLPDIPEEYLNTAVPVAAYLKKPFKLANFEALLERLNLGLDAETQK